MCSKYILRILSLWEIIQIRSSRSRSLQNNTAQMTPVNFNPVMECHLIHWILHPEMEVSRSSWNIVEASGIIWKLEWFNWHHKIANLKRENTHTQTDPCIEFLEAIRWFWKPLSFISYIYIYIFYNHMEPIEVIKNSNKAFVRQKYLIWNGGTDRQTQTGPYIELRYAQLTMSKKSWTAEVQRNFTRIAYFPIRYGTK